jgi:NACalpha-BTF3-like transcription factor
MGIGVRVMTAWLTAAALLVSSPAWGQQHVVDSAAMAEAIAQKHATDSENRQVVERVLARHDVQVMAARMGLDVQQARTALAEMTSEELAAVSQPARAAEADLSGGQTTVVISLTTLLLIIIIVLLVAD